MIKTFDGYTYDTETRQVTFTQRTCTSCNGTRKVERGISCPHNHKTVTKYPGRVCPDCGAKNQYSHKMIGTKVIECPNCNGTGIENTNAYDHLNAGELASEIELVTMAGLHGSTFNEGYLGIGIIAGVTDYGRYLDESKKDFTKILEIVRREMVEDLNRRQMISILTEDGKLIEKALLKMNADGWHVYAIGTKSSRILGL